jgi:hypothetical protein
MSNEYLFTVIAHVTVDADSEEAAREAMWNSCLYQEEDVDYNGIEVYVNAQDAIDGSLIEIYDPETKVRTDIAVKQMEEAA